MLCPVWRLARAAFPVSSAQSPVAWPCPGARLLWHVSSEMLSHCSVMFGHVWAWCSQKLGAPCVGLCSQKLGALCVELTLVEKNFISGCAHSMWKFPGQGLVLSYSSDDVRALTTGPPGNSRKFVGCLVTDTVRNIKNVLSFSFSLSLFFNFIFLVFLELHPQHMEVPSRG